MRTISATHPSGDARKEGLRIFANLSLRIVQKIPITKIFQTKVRKHRVTTHVDDDGLLNRGINIVVRTIPALTMRGFRKNLREQKIACGVEVVLRKRIKNSGV